MLRAWRKAISLFLVGLVCLTTGGFAVAGVAAELQHEVTQTESHTPPHGDEGKACDHCCACHYSSHLFSTTSAPLADSLVLTADDASAELGVPASPRPSDSFFRPPRIS